ncbi:sulfate adenylyltransferase subunit 1 [Croceiramulus getboli]|nr:GTP-binding protein [Flavobacteriaceae bacterium YJPT1-3]
MDVLKLATAGSVDDGKSTLIGRLLYDTQSLTDDKVAAIKKSSERLGYDYLDFSLATDGLIAEREQGITIDVAHIYFSTPSRSYIIADTPGHVEYTRNMVTGASNAQASIILIDARKGVVEQTYRHFFINDLLRVKHLIVAVNKMDLVDYDAKVFASIKDSFEALVKQRTFEEQEIHYVPVSALKGDNVASSSAAMDWFQGSSVLDLLERIPTTSTSQTAMRFPVQTVIRPKRDAYHDYRAYAGTVLGQSIQVGDAVTILPSLKDSRIASIRLFDKEYEAAEAGSAVSITLEDDLQVTRGDLIVPQEKIPQQGLELKAKICWMDEQPLQVGNKYELQIQSNRVLTKVKEIHHKIATDFGDSKDSMSEVALNEIAEVSFRLSKTLFYDSFASHKATGSFILIDTHSNTTAGVGFIQ